MTHDCFANWSVFFRLVIPVGFRRCIASTSRKQASSWLAVNSVEASHGRNISGDFLVLAGWGNFSIRR
jgi:hypothetical protein